MLSTGYPQVIHSPVWPFKAKSAPKAETIDPRSIESRMRALELDWEDTYERIRRVLQRISKRAEIIEKKEAAEHPQMVENSPDSGFAPGPPGLTARLSDRQKEVQRLILRRRGGS
jgi:hypothetical protein